MNKEEQILYLIKNPIELAKLSFKFFCLKVIKILYPNHYGKWESLAKENKQLLVECARDHGKSYFWSFAYPLYEAMRNPGWEICLISYSQDQAIRLIEKIKNEIEVNNSLGSLRPKKDATWSKTELACGNGAKITAESFGTSSRGGHYHLIVVDDPLKDFGGMTPEDQKRFFFGAVIPMLRPGGQLVTVGTPVEFGDLLEELENNKSFIFKSFPAINDKDEILWPERYGRELLNERRKTMPQALYDREYLLKRITTDSVKFRREWLKFYEELPAERFNYFITVDPAIGQKDENDYTAISVAAVTVRNDWYVVDIIRDRLDPSQILEKLFLLYGRYHPLKIGIETVAYQQSLVHFAKQLMRERNIFLPIEELRPGTKTTKEMRILGLQPKFESGGIFIKKDLSQPFIDEYLSYPRGRTDDIMDSLAYMTQIIKAPSRIFLERDPYDAGFDESKYTGYIGIGA